MRSNRKIVHTVNHQTFFERLIGMGALKRTGRSQTIANLNERMLNSVTDGIYVIDMDSIVLFWNAAAERMTGYTIEAFAEHSLHELIHHTNSDGRRVPVCECPVYHSLRGSTSISVDRFPVEAVE